MSAWLQRFGSTAQPLARLFCFPHAGGAAAAFRLWRERLPERVELIAIELPGRAFRLRESPIGSVPALTQILTSELAPYLDRPYAFFGHSMGAVLAVEVAHATLKAGRAGPAHVFLSSRRPPHLPRPEEDLHRLSDDEFLKAIVTRYGGIPTEVLEESELLALLLPALRADITALETFTPAQTEPLSCAVTAYGGDQDPAVTLDQVRAWRGYTSGPFRVRQFPGGHFYLQTARAELLADVGQALMPLVAGTAAGEVPGRQT